MAELGCYGCPTGHVNYHVDGAKAWFECECGQYRGFAIDMSDTNHAEMALDAWNDQARAYALSAEEGADQLILFPELDPSDEDGPVEDDQQEEGGGPPPSEAPPHVGTASGDVASGGVSSGRGEPDQLSDAPLDGSSDTSR